MKSDGELMTTKQLRYLLRGGLMCGILALLLVDSTISKLDLSIAITSVFLCGLMLTFLKSD